MKSYFKTKNYKFRREKISDNSPQLTTEMITLITVHLSNPISFKYKLNILQDEKVRKGSVLSPVLFMGTVDKDTKECWTKPKKFVGQKSRPVDPEICVFAVTSFCLPIFQN